MTTPSLPCVSCLLPVPAGMTLCPSCGASVLPDRAEPVVEPTIPQHELHGPTEDQTDMQAPAMTALQYAPAAEQRKATPAKVAPPAEVTPPPQGGSADRVPTREELPFRNTRRSHGAMTAEGEGPTGSAPADSEAPGLRQGDIVLRQYRIEKKLGAGGMGTVYLAVDDVSHQKVAIKALPASLAHDKAIVERFTQEARALAALDHPAIVPLITFANEGDDRFLVMKYIEGTNLDDLLGERTRLDFDTAQHIFEHVTDALGYAHANGVVHRDIKPANVLIADDNRVFLVDFGIAKQEQGVKLTQTGMLMGTPQYMSPEQISGQAVDGRSDLYGAGLILYEMLTGQPPFTGEKTFAVLKAHVESKVPDPAKLRGEEIPPHLTHVIAELLKKNPNDRPQTAAAAKALLLQAPGGAAPDFGAPLDLEYSGPVNTPITTSLIEDDMPTFQRGATAAWVMGGLLFFAGLAAFAYFALLTPEVAELPEPVADTVDQTPDQIQFMLDRSEELIEEGDYRAALTLLEKGLNKHDALLPEVVAIRIAANIELKRRITAQRWLDALKATPNLTAELSARIKELQDEIDGIKVRTPRKSRRKSSSSSSSKSTKDDKAASTDTPASTHANDDKKDTSSTPEKTDKPRRGRFENANAGDSQDSAVDKKSTADKPKKRSQRGRFQNANETKTKSAADKDKPKDTPNRGRGRRPARYDNAQ